MAENHAKLPSFIKEYKFIEYLIPYFKKHTVLAAALIAGFVGAVTQYIILEIYPIPKFKVKKIFILLLITFIISGLLGFVMKASKLFPYLDETYYKSLGNIKGAIHDGVSGVIVQITLLLIIFLKN